MAALNIFGKKAKSAVEAKDKNKEKLQKKEKETKSASLVDKYLQDHSLFGHILQRKQLV
jgi:hypothetical protein